MTTIRSLLIVLLIAGAGYARASQNAQPANHPNPLVGHIRITGNAALSERSILQVMFTKPSHWWKKSRFQPQVFQDDLRSITTLYNNRGFLDAAIASWDTTYVSRNRVNIRITISEGERSRVGNITFQDNQAVAASQLRELIKIQEGDPFSFLNLSESTWSIINKYAELGYLDARVDPRIDEQNHVIQVLYRIQEGNPVYVDSVIIRGNEKTKSRVIRRELTMHPGDLLTHQKVVTSQQNLYKTGLFNSVSITPLRDSTGSVYDPVVVRLVEARTGEINFGLGYGSLEKIRFSTEILQGNLLGTGQKIGFQNRFSFTNIALEGLYTVPYFFVGGVKLDNTAYYRREMQSNYTVNRLGIESTLGRQLFQYSRIFSTFRVENNRFSKIEKSSVLDSTGDRIRSLSLTLNRDTRQNVFNPDRGSFFSLSGLLAGQIFQATDSYVRVVGDYIKYVPLNTAFKFVTKISAGRLFEIGKTSSVPIYERFFAGGDYSIRGYKERSVGPTRNGQPVGGYTRLVLQNEIRFPLYKKLQGAVFLDTGDVWGESAPIHFSDMRSGAGIGLLYSTPLGLVRVDYGWKIHPRPGEAPARIHFTLGQTL